MDNDCIHPHEHILLPGIQKNTIFADVEIWVQFEKPVYKTQSRLVHFVDGSCEGVLTTGCPAVMAYICTIGFPRNVTGSRGPGKFDTANVICNVTCSVSHVGS
jgi:hypothetical protein